MDKWSFVFCVGYQDSKALVDKEALRKYRGSSAEELLNQNLFRYAFALALYENDVRQQEKILERFNQKSPRPYTSVEQLQRVFGIQLSSQEGVNGILEV